MTSDGADPDSPPFQAMFGFPPPPARWDLVLAGPHNAAALRIAVNPENWATPVLAIMGPAKCGLSFLAEAWAGRFDGALMSPATLTKVGRRGLDELAARHVAVDDADPGGAKQDEALLSLMNLVSASGGRLLLLSHRAPSQWRTPSADLRSRLKALPTGEIGPPDEGLLRERLILGAERRFLRLSPETLNYLVPRLELAYDAAENFMDRLSNAVSQHDRAPSLPLARLVLNEMTGGGEDNAAER